MTGKIRFAAGILAVSLGAAPLCRAVALSIPERTAEAASTARTLTRSAYRDKLKGAWTGALWGNFTGLPTEFVYTDTPNPSDTVNWVVGKQYVTDDDTSLEWVFLHMMDVYGANDITYADMPEEWLYHFQDYIWEGNYTARGLMMSGLLPPETGSKEYNKDWRDIDAQIECEVFGLITPGMLLNAKTRTEWWMAAVGDGAVLTNAAFYAMLCSEAFFTSDVISAVDTVMEYFPADSETYATALRVKEVHRENPSDWRAARNILHREFYINNAYQPYVNIDSQINFASTLMSILYGENDFKKTVEIAVLAGYDNDCNAATAATIMGAACGESGLPADLLEKSGNVYQNTNRPGLPDDTISGIAEKCLRFGEEILLSAGGKITGEGETAVYEIRDRAFEPKTDDTLYKKKIPASDKAWKFSGMSFFHNSEYLNGKGAGTVRAGDSAELTFSGTQIALKGCTSVNGGTFEMFIDGKSYGDVSLKSAETYTASRFISMSYAQTLKKVRGLSDEKHTLRLVSKESGKWHAVDYAVTECSEEEYYSDASLNLARTPAATVIGSVPSPWGSGNGGNHNLGVICDGNYFTGDLQSQNDTFLGYDGNGKEIDKNFEDYYGYTFSREFSVKRIVFQEGAQWDQGGWFADGSLRVEALVDGVWTRVGFTASPLYPNGSTHAEFGENGEMYTFLLTQPVVCEGIRIIGTPGGRQKFVSCGELEVYCA